MGEKWGARFGRRRREMESHMRSCEAQTKVALFMIKFSELKRIACKCFKLHSQW